MDVICKDNLSLKSMPKMSRDVIANISDKRWMAKGSGSEYNQGFLKRTKTAREGARFTQEEIARILQITQDVYKQYETRSLLPHRLIGPFCAATRVSEAWLITGQEAARPRNQSTEARTAS